MATIADPVGSLVSTLSTVPIPIISGVLSQVISVKNNNNNNWIEYTEDVSAKTKTDLV